MTVPNELPGHDDWKTREPDVPEEHYAILGEAPASALMRVAHSLYDDVDLSHALSGWLLESCERLPEEMQEELAVVVADQLRDLGAVDIYLTPEEAETLARGAAEYAAERRLEELVNKELEGKR